MYGLVAPPHGGRGLKFTRNYVNPYKLSRPPSRGAWIEIRRSFSGPMPESPSPPSRGAWIEIRCPGDGALDRHRRPPHGGRGLKYYWEVIPVTFNGRPPRGGRGLKWCCPSQTAYCSPFSFIVSFLFPLYTSRSKKRPIIPLHSTRRACPPRCAPEASGTSPSLRLLQLAHDLLAHRLLRILRRGILDLRRFIP